MANKINVVLGLDIAPFQRSLNRMQGQLNRFASSMQNAGRTLTESLTLPIAAMGGVALKSFADLEKLNKGLIAIMGSSEAASAEFEKLREVAKLPGLGLKEAVQGSINLQAVGLSADEARKALQGFGAAIAVTGGGKQDLQEVQRQLTQIISKNRILQEDYGVLQERIPLIGDALQLAFNTRNIENVRAMGVSGQEFVKRISDALVLLPETQNVTGGLANAFENLQDSVYIAGAQFGEAINKSLNLEKVLGKVATAVQRAADWFSNLSPGMQKIIVISAVVVAAIGPVLLIFGKMISVIPVMITGLKALGTAFTFMTGPVGIAIAVIGAIVAGVVYAYNKFEGFRRVINGLGNAFKEVITIFKEAGKAFFEGFAALKEGDFKSASENFKKAFTVGIPTEFARQYGKRVKDAFTDGFADNTNYLKKTQDEFKAAISGGASVGAGGAGVGKGGALTISPVFDYRGIEAGFKKLEQLSLPLIEQLKTKITNTLKTNIDDSVGLAGSGFLNLLPAETQNQFQKFTNEVLPAFNESLALADEKGKAFGLSFGDVLKEKVGITTAAFSETISVWGLSSEQAEVFRLKLVDLTAQLTELQKVQEMITAVNGAFTSSWEAGAAAVNEAGATIKTVMKAIGRAALQSAAEFAKAKIIEGVTSVIAKTLASAGPLGIFLAGAAGAAAGAIFQAAINGIQKPKLARGGMTTGLTTAIVGDNPSGKEAIIPFERMGEFLNMAGASGSTRLTGLFEVRGSDLIMAVDRARQEQSRIR